VPPEVEGWRSVTFEMAPLADKIQIPRGPCCEKDIILAATSCWETAILNWSHFIKKRYIYPMEKYSQEYYCDI
jgi:hypothetical protein